MGFCLDEPVFMAGPKPMRTEFGIHLGLESCGGAIISNLPVALGRKQRVRVRLLRPGSGA